MGVLVQVRLIFEIFKAAKGCNKAQYLILSTEYHQIQEGLKMFCSLIMLKATISNLHFPFCRYKGGVIDKCGISSMPGTRYVLAPRH